jgi:predicted phosphatase
MEITMSKIPTTDSIEELARFWDTRDVTDFEDELEEVEDPVFERQAGLEIQLPAEDVAALEEVARARGTKAGVLVREWISEKLAQMVSQPGKLAEAKS